jgi:DNA adenine methylase
MAERAPKTIRYVTPLRYPGGKAKLANFVQRLLEANDLLGGTYVEAYAGGASVALALLLHRAVSRVHINDLDPSIHAFWHSVLHEPEGLCRLIRNRRVSVAEWRRQQAIQRDPATHGLLELGFSTFFLNRTNRSGIICSGGMIGGAKQRGQWKLDARFNKAELIERIERITAYNDRISLYREDAAHFLTRLLPTLPKTSFVYLDPPYYVKGTRRLYANFYEHTDHAHIAEVMGRSRRPWLVSYDDQPEIRRLYRAFRSNRYRLSYTARDRYEGAEVLFFSKGLTLPRLQYGYKDGNR